MPESLGRDITRQFIYLAFGVASAAISAIVVYKIMQPDVLDNYMARVLLAQKRFCDKQAEWWTVKATRAAQLYQENRAI